MLQLSIYILFNLVHHVFSNPDIQFIVTCQNNLRSSFARGHDYTGRLKAANMRELKWDSTLALSAQILADTKRLNLSTEETLRGFTISYWNELFTDFEMTIIDCNLKLSQATTELWNPEKLTSTMVDKMPQAMQMLWARSSRIGCATKKWINLQGAHTTIVCNYDIPIQVNQSIFREGTPCKLCPRNTVCNMENGLCVG